MCGDGLVVLLDTVVVYIYNRYSGELFLCGDLIGKLYPLDMDSVDLSVRRTHIIYLSGTHPIPLAVAPSIPAEDETAMPIKEVNKLNRRTPARAKSPEAKFEDRETEPLIGTTAASNLPADAKTNSALSKDLF